MCALRPCIAHPDVTDQTEGVTYWVAIPCIPGSEGGAEEGNIDYPPIQY